jgi:hypothetical protein
MQVIDATCARTIQQREQREIKNEENKQVCIKERKRRREEKKLMEKSSKEKNHTKSHMYRRFPIVQVEAE